MTDLTAATTSEFDRLLVFQKARQSLIQAYRDWLVLSPNPAAAAHECDLTDRLMIRVRTAANLRGF